MNMEYSVVDITISRNTLGVKRDDFGSILIIGGLAANGVAPKLKEYFSLAEVLADYPYEEDEPAPEYAMARDIFAQEISVKKILIGQRAFTESMIQAYTRIESQYEFYAVVVATEAAMDLIQLALTIEASGTKARSKIFGALEYSTDQESPNFLAFTKAAHAAKLNRTFICYSKPVLGGRQFMQGAWLGKMLPTTPGAENWAFKTLTGITPDLAKDGLNQTVLNELATNNGNLYTKNGSEDKTFWGKMASGEYIDVIYGIDWLDHTMQQDLIDLFNHTPKINYTNAGISLVETAMRQSLELAKSRGVIDSYTITTPNAANVSFGDKANRELKGVTFQAILTGAINKVVINGYVTL